MQPLLSCRNVSKRFAGTQALKDVELQLMPGEINALIGENGAGKSTLIKILSGIYKNDTGEIECNGKMVEIGSIDAARALGIAVIHQELSIVKALTAPENVFLGKEIIKNKTFRTLDSKKMAEKTKEVFEILGVDIPLNVMAKDLSIAQCQLIEIAKALRENARVLILDEPTTALTSEEVEALLKVLRQLRAEGTAVLYVSHRLEEIYRISDKITVLRDGQFVGCEPTKDLPQERLISMMVGREISHMYPKKQSKIGDVILEVSRLNQKSTLKNINLKLRKGELLGIGGLMGAGRTELARAIAGIDRYESGEIILNGNVLKFRHPRNAIDKGIVLVPEDRKLSGLHVNLSVLENTTLPTVSKFQKWLQIDKKSEAKAVNDIIGRLSVKTAGPMAKIKTLSGGNQQKVAIGKWLLVDDIKVFILDEPTRGVDVGAKSEIYKVMETILEEEAAIIMVSSDLPELLAMSDRIVVMREGEIMGELSKEEATEQNVMRLATGGRT